MRIRVATLNTWALPDPFGHRVRARMRAIGERLDALGADLVALQEVWRDDARSLLCEAGVRAGLPHSWWHSSSLVGGGLLVLSRWPIGSHHFERFQLPGVPPRLDHPDYYGGKGFGLVRLATRGGALWLADTHLHARYRSDVPHAYRAYRVGQITQLAMRAARIREPIVLAGDFNLEEGDVEYRVLAGLTGARDAAAEAQRRDPTVFPGNAYRSGSREKRVDYVWLRDGTEGALRARAVERVFDEPVEIRGRRASYSNHAGVLVEVELAGRASGPLPALDPEAARLAAGILAEGRTRAKHHRRESRALAGAGLGVAVLAAAGVRNRRVTRRRFLRGGIEGTALLAVASTAGLSLVTELFTPDELHAFEGLAARLARVAGAPPTRSSPSGAVDL
jgi:sphingomyelin phosphodiesterase 2